MITKLTIEYDGAAFAGWARQPGLRTVQGELEAALAVVLRHHATLTVAGRTDRGVHAWAQVASYEGPPVRPGSVNALLGDDVAVVAAEAANPTFDARRDATSRAYCYRVLARSTRSPAERGRALWWPYPIDRAALEPCAALLPGTHDLRAFTPTQTRHTLLRRRVLSACWRAEGDLLEFWIEAETFMRHSNRVLVGTMLEVAGGRRTVEQFAELLSGRSRCEAGPTAPAEGLHLAAVGYGHEAQLLRVLAASGRA